MVDDDDEATEDPDVTGDLVDPDLEDLPDDDVIEVDLDDDDDDDDGLDDDAVEVDVVDDDDVAPVVVATPGASDDDDEDDDDEDDEDDVEASLDVILKEKLVVADEEEDEEPPDTEDRTEVTPKVLPKRPDEFVCQSCFLVKHPSQLADHEHMLCRDCV